MTFVITSPCIDCKDGACIFACPVDCIYEGGRMMYIHPKICISCGACESVCPVEAIFHIDDLPDSEERFAEENASFFVLAGLDSPKGGRTVGALDFDTPYVAASPPGEAVG
jgi:NAD-dependent dihydropyrimidine dehydrogenase PreA subunit